MILYSLPSIIRAIELKRMRWGGAPITLGGEVRCLQVLIGSPEGRRSLERSRRRWENTIKMDLQELGRSAWTKLIWLRIRTGGGLL
jgi:hypothetical protein